MNPLELSASELLIWGIVLHLIADWPLQNDWMANNKWKRADFLWDVWCIRHPAAYIHASIHTVLLGLIFGWVAIPLGIIHLVIDCRWIVVKWSKLMRQTQPQGFVQDVSLPEDPYLVLTNVPIYDIGTEVRFWTDQVFHIVTIAIAALLVTI